MAKEKNAANVSNIYRLEGRVPVAKYRLSISVPR